ncbi:NUDIX domain-containing protein [Streptomyces sp. NPDC023723]|uniref:NUDIX hydrolase n=1 Tax=Streptomyces sp. NPDC023723 TaxID=3154323 RepID=UPI0033DB7F2E
MQDDVWSPPPVLLTVDLVILTLREGRLCVLLVERGEDPFQGMQALPGGFLNHAGEEILDAAHRELAEETALGAGWVHLEQLATYGDASRDPRGRVVSVAHLAIAPGLPAPVAGTDATDASWVPADAVLNGDVKLAFDHHRIVTDGIERARTKLEFSALATAFCGELFTITELQQVYEAVWGTELDTRNFYRKVQAVKGFIVPAGSGRRSTGGRPARLYRAGPRTVLFPPLIRPTPSPTEEETTEGAG